MHGATLNMYTIFLLVSILFPGSDVGDSGQQLMLGAVMAQLLLLAHLPERWRTFCVTEGLYGVVCITMATFKAIYPLSIIDTEFNILKLLRLLLSVCHFHPLSVLVWNVMVSSSLALSLSQDEGLSENEWGFIIRNEMMSTLAFFLVSFCCLSAKWSSHSSPICDLLCFTWRTHDIICTSLYRNIQYNA